MSQLPGCKGQSGQHGVTASTLPGGHCQTVAGLTHRAGDLEGTARPSQSVWLPEERSPPLCALLQARGDEEGARGGPQGQEAAQGLRSLSSSIL